jgi:mono/diheme cytochrome c family protein
MKRFIAVAALLGLACGSGCKKEARVAFEPNLVYAHGLQLDTGYSMAQAAKETELAVAEFFGTPDSPKLPDFILEDEEYSQLVSLERIEKAAGPVGGGQGRGLYRQHCVTCHGITGNGRGETAALLDPYPRDFRLGKFKFKSTTRGAKPLREDLAFTIRHGIDGTSMKQIPELTNEDIDALVDYVIYLSWRGEFERSMLMEGSELDFEGGEDGSGAEHLYNPRAANFEDQLANAKEFVTDIADTWLEAEDRVREVPEPDGIVVPDTTEELLAMVAAGDSALKHSIDVGRELFASELAACGKCHGVQGYGDGPTIDYDDWTKEWTQRIGIDPTNLEEQIPLIARGALPARAIKPRDFREGLYRGGSSPEQLYLRIAAGIEGTPMPAATIELNDIWHLVNYIRSMAPPAPESSVTAGTDPTEPATADEAKGESSADNTTAALVR